MPFGGKLYLEFGGKLFDDYHASRVLPGFQPDSKMKMLLQLKEQAEIVIAINAARHRDEQAPRRSGHHLRSGRHAPHRRVPRHRAVCGQRRALRSTPASRQPDLFQRKLESAGCQGLPPLPHRRLSLQRLADRLATTATAKTSTSRPAAPIVVVTAPGPGSGKMATCLSQLYQEHQARRQRGLCQV